MELIIGILLGLAILVFLVVIHELGHAIVARRNGVVVQEFGIGFPPRAWGKKLKNGILLSLNWLPLGGFVRMQGEHDAASGKGDYGAASFWQKTKILLAGVGINWLFAALLLTILALTGMPKVLPNQFSVPSDAAVDNSGVVLSTLASDLPASKAGFRAGDVVTKFDDKQVVDASQFIELTKEYRGQNVEINYERDGASQQRDVTLLNNADGPTFGAAVQQTELVRHTWSAPIVGFGTAAQLTLVTLQGLGQLVIDLVQGVVGQVSPSEDTRSRADEQLGQVSDSVSGPVGILGVLFPSVSQAGLTQIVFFTALISLSLAIMNFLPIPALDGGRWFTMAIFRIIKKPLTKEREENIQATGVLVLLALIVAVTFSDVSKLIN